MCTTANGGHTNCCSASCIQSTMTMLGFPILQLLSKYTLLEFFSPTYPTRCQPTCLLQLTNLSTPTFSYACSFRSLQYCSYKCPPTAVLHYPQIWIHVFKDTFMAVFVLTACLECPTQSSASVSLKGSTLWSMYLLLLFRHRHTNTSCTNN